MAHIITKYQIDNEVYLIKNEEFSFMSLDLLKKIVKDENSITQNGKMIFISKDNIYIFDQFGKKLDINDNVKVVINAYLHNKKIGKVQELRFTNRYIEKLMKKNIIKTA